MFNEERTEFKFEWSHLGDIDKGRPQLGSYTNVAIYRLMQFTLRDACIKHTDVATTSRIFYDAGFNAGRAIYENMLGHPAEFNEFAQKLRELLEAFSVGLLNFEEADLETMSFKLTISEDLDCSGVPEQKESICTFDEGFIAALLESFTGVKFIVKEVDCWCTGNNTCRFEAKPASS
ncbi:MAG: V4R domain-containing protein [Lentisphaerota bacterium]